MKRAALFLAILAALAGGDSCTTTPDADSCNPGQSTACLGSGGCPGDQVCNATGSGYSSCECRDGFETAPDALATLDSGRDELAEQTPDSTLLPDSAQTDLGQTDPGQQDLGTPDQGTDYGKPCLGGCPPDRCAARACVGGECVVMAVLTDGAVPYGPRDGLCYDGELCTGCWDGTACQSGSDADACGAWGGACRACTVSNWCKTSVCLTGACMEVPLSGTPCTGYGGAAGECADGACQECGKDGQSCCPVAGCSEGECLIFAGVPSCHFCGQAGQFCCADYSCAEPNKCDGASRTCVPKT